MLFGRKPAPNDDRWEALNEEYQNYRRRTALELLSVGEQSARKTAAAFLGLYDDLQRALESPCADPAFLEGIRLIQRNLMDTFAALGIRPMDSKGRIFNPDYHEAVEHIHDPQYRAGEIVTVIRTGFTMDEQVLRHAKVIAANCDCE